MQTNSSFSRKTLSVQGKQITFETGQVAKQANGAVLVRMGETIVFASACAKDRPEEEATFFPLRVDYQEKQSSVGRTLGGFIKREGKPSEREVLISRLIDRPLRPLFQEGYMNETQILAYVWSYDRENPPEALAICAASAALTLSDIPLVKPIAAVRVGRIGKEWIVNPTVEEMKQSSLDLVLAGTQEAILMIEGYCDFLSEEELISAVEVGQRAVREICCFLSEWAKERGKEKRTECCKVLPFSLLERVQGLCEEKLQNAFCTEGKLEREKALREVQEELLEGVQETEPTAYEFSLAYEEVKKRLLRRFLCQKKVRVDGRGFEEIRPISIEMSWLSRTHGSALFTRGQTQTVTACTLGSEGMAQRFETLDGEGASRFYLQYSFPPFCVGEVGRMGPPGRREVGHGKLAERALLPVIPSIEKFPYFIRLESTITESNGSSSMASVCGGTLALMQAGVPIEEPISGIAMGLILEEGESLVLSDISGLEDAMGDMDFKVAGGKRGVTAFQMDIKVEGITLDILRKALLQAREGRLAILDRMLEHSLNEKELSEHAPRIEIIPVPRKKIGKIIGPGGNTIRDLIERTGAEISVDDNEGVRIFSSNADNLKKAKEEIQKLVREPEVGKVYEGKVVSIVHFGLFIEILPGYEGLCHISEISNHRIEDIESVATVGEKMQVKVLEINNRGQIRLTRREIDPLTSPSRSSSPFQKPSGKSSSSLAFPPPPFKKMHSSE